MSKVLIAGGTGFVGQLLEAHLIESGHEVKILTRSPKKDNHVQWNPDFEEIETGCEKTEILINLCGAGIADKRWTEKRKQELLESRTTPLLFLAECAEQWPALKLVISSSGIDCYPEGEKDAIEEDAYANNFLGELIQTWEEAMNTFPGDVRIVKMRMPLVLHPDGGALEKLLSVFNKGVGSQLGNGKQIVNWIHHVDLLRFVSYAMERKVVNGTYNVCGDGVSNRLWTKLISHNTERKIWLPPIPGFLLKLVLGEMAEVLLKGRKASNHKLLRTGFKLKFIRTDLALNDLLSS